jgi:hypothetical protein
MSPKPWYLRATSLLWIFAVCLLVLYLSLLVGARFA